MKPAILLFASALLLLPIDTLRAQTVAPSAAPPEKLVIEIEVPAALPDAPSSEVCAKAFLAFRKRFALTVLDEESKLGRNPLTKGAKSTIAGIIPPNEWPEAVWQELVRQGKLRYLGRGFYEPVKP